LVRKLEGKCHLEVLVVDGRIILKWITDVRVWTGFIWLRIGTNGGLLWTRSRNLGFHKKSDISISWAERRSFFGRAQLVVFDEVCYFRNKLRQHWSRPSHTHVVSDQQVVDPALET
jgi:hypothetical protein